MTIMKRTKHRCFLIEHFKLSELIDQVLTVQENAVRRTGQDAFVAGSLLNGRGPSIKDLSIGKIPGILAQQSAFRLGFQTASLLHTLPPIVRIHTSLHEIVHCDDHEKNNTPILSHKTPQSTNQLLEEADRARKSRHTYRSKCIRRCSTNKALP